MPVSVLQGDPTEQILASGTHVGGTGHIFTFNSITWWSFVGAHVPILTTATAGTRNFIFQFFDTANNMLFEDVASAGQGPSLTFKYMLGAAQPLYGASSIVSVPTPLPFLLPPGFTMLVFDGLNLDANDALNGNAIFLFGV